MATVTVSLPAPMKDWIEDQAKIGKFASVRETRLFDYAVFRECFRPPRCPTRKNYEYSMNRLPQTSDAIVAGPRHYAIVAVDARTESNRNEPAV